MAKRKNESVPNGFVYRLLQLPIMILSRRGRRLVFHRNVPEPIEGPVLILANHVSYWDWAYIPQTFPRHRLTVIANRFYFRTAPMRFLLGKIRAIPKTMMYPDFETIRKVVRAAKDGRYLVMFPEARLSTDGTSQDVVPGIGALIRKLAIPVIFVEIAGASLASPKWAKHPRRGTVEITVKERVAPEAFAAMSPEAIDRFVTDRLFHDESEYASRSGNRYPAKDLTAGIEGILYVCPACGSEFSLHGGNDRVVCDECGHSATMKDDGTFVSDHPEIANVRDWHRLQHRHEKERLEAGNFAFDVEVEVLRMDLANPRNDLRGTGTVRVRKDGIEFDGIVGIAPERFDTPAGALTAIAFKSDVEFELYHKGYLYYCHPKGNSHLCAKVSVAADVIAGRRIAAARDESTPHVEGDAAR
ncbi:MAG: 1-acyl-sn-glycerol-3-phosphate acyltransferase [Candidatus Izemoplasmatales bacterium]